MRKIQFGEYTYTTAELKQMHEEATERGKRALKTEPRAKAVSFDKRSDRLVIDLIDGTTIAIPRHRLQGLRDAAPGDIAEVELMPFGLGLHWEKLDVDFTVTGLVSRIFGTKAWMSELGRKGGSVSSDAKAAAARANGKKGGRPKTKSMSAKSGS